MAMANMNVTGVFVTKLLSSKRILLVCVLRV